MPSNLLLLLPLLGGYLFFHFYHRTFFRAQALEGHRLIFETAVAGFVGYVPFRLLILTLSQLDSSNRWHEAWYGFAGQVPHLSTLVAMLLGAPLLAFGLNIASGLRCRKGLPPGQRLNLSSLLAASKDRALGQAVERSGNALQLLLYKAAKRTRVDLTTVCLTLRDRKVFVGWITKSPNLRANDTYVAMVPLMSGHRDKDTLQMKLDTTYPMEMYWDGTDLRPEEFVVALPVTEIATARLFDLDLYLSGFASGSEVGDEDHRASASS
jgi:hypothetical protein